MKRNMIAFALVLVVLTGCLSTDSNAGQKSTRVSREIIDLVSAACVEIVVLKPQENPEITYEKELPWDNVPYYIRSDKYFSIGTAFAVGENELCTAQHVLDLDTKSRSFSRYFIRDSAGKVYELDQILRSDRDRDVTFFTAKGKTFATYFKINKNYTVNQSVFTVGSALGEGIVIRDGLLIGTIPEEEEGRWLYLKSSAGANPGNSGGPLLDPAGEVVGVVQWLKDNIVYSLPVSEFDNTEPDAAVFTYRNRWGLTNIVAKLRKNHTFKIALPKNYLTVKEEAFAAYMKNYNASMGQLLEENKATMFPAGKTSKLLLNAAVTTYYPEILFEDKDNKVWSISDTKTSSYDLDHEGRIIAGTVGGFTSLQYIKPKNVTLNSLFSDPKLFMDSFLKGINIPRRLGGDKIRITSFGQPITREKLTDRWGRKWFINTWFVNYNDEVLITFTSPTPQGLVCFFKETSSGKMDGWLYDFKVLADYFFFSYLGTFEQWTDFLKEKAIIPELFTTISFDYKAGDHMKFASKRLEISYTNADFPVNDDSHLSFTMSYFTDNGRVVWDVRKIIIDKDKTSDDYFLVYREMKPDPDLPEAQQSSWTQLLKQKAPITGKPYVEKNLTRLGHIHPKYMNGDVPKDDLTLCYVVYMGLEGTLKNEEMISRMDAMDKGITILE